MKRNFLKTALAAALFAVAGGQQVMAQDTFLTNPNDVPSGYYYVVSSYNESYAWTVNGEGEFVVDELDETDVKFIFYATGRNTDSESTKKQDGKKVSELGTALRIRFFWGTPYWTDFSSDPKVFWTLGGLGSNSNQQVLKVNAEYGMHNWQNDVTVAGFRFNASNRGYNIAPQNGTFAKGQKLWYYANNTNNDQGRWKLKAVSNEQIAAVEATTPEAVIARIQAEEAVPNAISAYEQLMGYVNNIGTSAGQYNYTLTSEESALTDSQWGSAAGYAGLSTADINAKRDAFLALIPKIRWEYVSSLPDISIVTLQWNGSGRYNGINSNVSTGNWASSNGLGTPNGVNGRVALLKQADGKFVLNTRGAYLKNDQGVVFDKSEATRFAVFGTVETGLTFLGDDGKYLKESTFATQTTEPDQNFKVNTFQYYDRIDDTGNSSTDGNGNYANAYCYPFKVKKPEGEGFHTYVVTIVNGELQTEDVDVVPAGVPFIYVRNTNADPARRMYILQDNQEYADKPVETTLLRGFYFRDQRVDAKFYLGVKDGVFGFYNEDNTGTETNRAYITAEAAESLSGAKLFQLINGELVVTQTHEVTYKLVDSDNNELMSFSSDEVAHGADATVVPDAFNAGYTTVTKTGGPDVINDDATVTYTATWDALPFQLDTWYNLAMRPGDLRYASTETNAAGQYLVQKDPSNYQRTQDAYQWKLKGNPYALQVVAKDGRVVTLNNTDNFATLEENGTFTFKLVYYDAQSFRLVGNGIDGGQNYLADYQNPGKLGRYSADAGTVIQAEAIPTVPASLDLTVTAAGYATFASEWPVDFTNVTSVTAYRVEITGTEVAFKKVDGAVPAGEGLLIEGIQGQAVNVSVPVATTVPATFDNELVGVLADTKLDAGIFVLMNGTKGVGFYKTTNEEGFTVRANSAYLPAIAAPARDFIGFSDDTTTGIFGNEELRMKNEESEDGVYDLQGRQIKSQTSNLKSQIKRGLYIVNGKKIIVK